ncbi:HTH-type transcriptional regulator MgrA [Oxobacter pfennigii]|uniref:HTH-type transcriptional regulator MgrA n=1 Tax=Oxobacter pfennigii TaxID=36849 RepID=A0A0P9AJA0_9CLOT|nr:MarR family transcriptional regulator [Oxobacter pfennigii]KPU45500.1 HTH-type transcriptional regulator MgrA [Oxobacter pfennigii]
MEAANGKIVIDLMRQVSAKFEKNLRQHFNDCNLTVPQMNVISLLSRYGEMRISDISGKMGLTNGTTSGIIDRLERIELVKRVRLEEDRRVVKVVLIKGVDSLNTDYDSRLCDCLDKMFGKVTREELQTIVKGLNILNDILDDKR